MELTPLPTSALGPQDLSSESTPHLSGREVQQDPYKVLPSDVFNKVLQFLDVKKAIHLREVSKDWKQYLMDPKKLQILVYAQVNRLGASLSFLRNWGQVEEESKLELPSVKVLVERRILTHAEKYGADVGAVKEKLASMSFVCIDQRNSQESLFLVGFHERGKEDPRKSLVGWMQSNEIIGDFGFFYEKNGNFICNVDGSPVHAFQEGKIVSDEEIQEEGKYGFFFDRENKVICNVDGSPFHAFQKGKQTFAEGSIEGDFGFFFDREDRVICDKAGNPIYSIQKGKAAFFKGGREEGKYGFFFDREDRVIYNVDESPVHALQEGKRVSDNGTQEEGKHGFFFDREGKVICDKFGNPIYAFQKGKRTFSDKIVMEGDFGPFFDEKGQAICNKEEILFLGFQSGKRTFPEGMIEEGDFGLSFDQEGNVICDKEGLPVCKFQRGRRIYPDGRIEEVGDTPFLEE